MLNTNTAVLYDYWVNGINEKSRSLVMKLQQDKTSYQPKNKLLFAPFNI
jgi:hypothetical protein